MLEKLANIFRIPELRTGCCSRWACWPCTGWARTFRRPASTPRRSRSSSTQNAGSALGLVDLFSGGSLRRLTIFALGIMPYITASIIFQLLTVIYEPLAKLQKEGEMGRRKITQWTRYVTVLLGVVQSTAIALTLTQTNAGQSMVTMSQVGLHPAVRAHPDRRHRLHHVAG